jgi:CRP-like cAMP-binding protein
MPLRSSAADHVEHLAKVPLFSGMSKKDLQKLAKVSDEVDIEAGRTLVDQGRVGHEFFLILEGEAVVRRNNRKVADLGPGEYFGEMAILDRGPRSASVVANTDMRVLVLTQSAFIGVLDTVPGMATKLLSHMAHRLREADSRAVGH